jgi:hypothetical protein
MGSYYSACRCVGYHAMAYQDYLSLLDTTTKDIGCSPANKPF